MASTRRTGRLVPYGFLVPAIVLFGLFFALPIGYAVYLTKAQPELRPSPLVWGRVFVALTPAVLVGMLVPVPTLVRLALSSAVYFGVLQLVGGIPGELRTTFSATIASRLRRS